MKNQEWAVAIGWIERRLGGSERIFQNTRFIRSILANPRSILDPEIPANPCPIFVT
jgi:hypothetical protein